MRGCLLALILLALVAVNGYAIWEIHSMKVVLEDLRTQGLLARADRPTSMADYARDAAEAVGRGEIGRAEADLQRLQELLESTQETAGRRREELLAQVRAAQRAVAEGSAQVKQEIERLVGMLPPARGSREAPTERD